MGAAFTLLACGALGYAALSWLRISCARGEAWALSLLVGTALFSTAILGLGVMGLVNRPVLFGAGIAALATPLFVRSLVVRRGRMAWIPLVVSAAYGFVYLIHAWAPEISPDGMAYHVALPAQYLREGRIGFIATNIYAQLSQAMEMLYLHAFAFGKHSATALVHLPFLFALLALVRVYAVRAGIPPSAALLVLVSPVVGIDAASAYNDVALAAVLFAVFWMMERWREEASDRLLWVAGLMVGLAFAVKYTAAMALPYAVLSLGRRMSWTRVSRIVLASGLVAGPWLLKNWLMVGNPVAPFANAWFPNEVFDPALESSYRAYLGFNANQPSLARIPYEVVMGGFALGGLLGAAFWLSPLALVSRWRLALPALLFMAPFALNLGTRFLIPGLPFVALGMAAVLTRVPGAWPAVVVAHVLLCWYPVTHATADVYAWQIKELPWRAALRLEPEREYIGRRVGEAAMFAHLQGLPGKVLSYSQFADSYAGAMMVTGSLSRSGVEMRELLWAANDREPRAGSQYWFPQRLLRGIRVTEKPEGGDGLRVAEMRVYHLMTELTAAKSVRTVPPSTEARFVVDGNRLTRWRGDQDPARRGSVELTWHEAALLSRVSLEGAPDAAVRVEGLTSDGAWRELQVMAERTWFPREDLRKSATRSLLEQGVGWILLGNGDFGRIEMEADPEGWGVRLKAQAGGQWLFEILK